MVEEENPKDLILGEGDIGDGESDLDEKYAPPQMKALMIVQKTWKGMVLLHVSDEIFWESHQSNL